MEKNRNNRIKRTLARVAIIASVILALSGCIVTVDSDHLSAPTVYATQGYYATTVSLTWSEVPGAVSYNYYYATTASGSYQYLGNTAAKSASVFVSYSSVSYFFRAVAVSSSGREGTPSAYTTGWAYLPTAPTIFATTNLVGQIIVSWNPVNDAVGYHVYDTTTQGTKKYLGEGVLDASGKYYYYYDTPPMPGTYFYKVESVYADNGISALSTEVDGRAY